MLNIYIHIYKFGEYVHMVSISMLIALRQLPADEAGSLGARQELPVRSRPADFSPPAAHPTKGHHRGIGRAIQLACRVIFIAFYVIHTFVVYIYVVFDIRYWIICVK